MKVWWNDEHPLWLIVKALRRCWSYFLSQLILFKQKFFRNKFFLSSFHFCGFFLSLPSLHKIESSSNYILELIKVISIQRLKFIDWANVWCEEKKNSWRNGFNEIVASCADKWQQFYTFSVHKILNQFRIERLNLSNEFGNHKNVSIITTTSNQLSMKINGSIHYEITLSFAKPWIKAGKRINKRIKIMLVLCGPFLNCLHQRVSDFFYNLILFMEENEQNIENWQIKINNFFFFVFCCGDTQEHGLNSKGCKI